VGRTAWDLICEGVTAKQPHPAGSWGRLKPQAPLLCRLFLGLFLLAMLGAAWLYPGGSWQEPDAVGHRFFENYWCDLLRDPALNQQPNRLAAALATLGLACLGIALVPYWLVIGDLLTPARRRFVRSAGVIAAVATVLVALLPSDRYSGLHAPAVLTAGCLGLACGALCSAWAVAHFRQVPAYATASLLLTSAAVVNLALYVHVAYFDGEDSWVLPSAQKIATFLLVAWMLFGLQASAGRPRP
jgi:hypothetical protein